MEDFTEIEIHLRLLRIQFNIPTIKIIIQNYVDYVIAERIAETDVKLGLSGTFYK